jgi:hypothetical protein
MNTLCVFERPLRLSAKNHKFFISLQMVVVFFLINVHLTVKLCFLARRQRLLHRNIGKKNKVVIFFSKVSGGFNLSPESRLFSYKNVHLKVKICILTCRQRLLHRNIVKKNKVVNFEVSVSIRRMSSSYTISA